MCKLCFNEVLKLKNYIIKIDICRPLNIFLYSVSPCYSPVLLLRVLNVFIPSMRSKMNDKIWHGSLNNIILYMLYIHMYNILMTKVLKSNESLCTVQYSTHSI